MPECQDEPDHGCGGKLLVGEIEEQKAGSGRRKHHHGEEDRELGVQHVGGKGNGGVVVFEDKQLVAEPIGEGKRAEY